jgi:hypothetical protein
MTVSRIGRSEFPQASSARMQIRVLLAGGVGEGRWKTEIYTTKESETANDRVNLPLLC